jgi:hypothetical protein
VSLLLGQVWIIGPFPGYTGNLREGFSNSSRWRNGFEGSASAAACIAASASRRCCFNVQLHVGAWTASTRVYRKREFITFDNSKESDRTGARFCIRGTLWAVLRPSGYRDVEWLLTIRVSPLITQRVFRYRSRRHPALAPSTPRLACCFAARRLACWSAGTGDVLH